MPVDLNVDLGELPNEPEELYALATVVNIACGGHAGVEASMKRAVELARSHGVRIAAHPSYPDREGFGRRSLKLPPSALYEAVVEQCDTLVQIAREMGARVELVKLHGALYHDAARDPSIAAAVLDGVVSALPDGPVIVGPGHGVLAPAAEARALPYAREGFADRRYDPNGDLVPRSSPNALIEDPSEAAEQAVRLARSGAFDTICVHGDTRGAVDIAQAVRDALTRENLLRIAR